MKTTIQYLFALFLSLRKTHAVHRISGSLLGPRNGCDEFVGFFFLVETPLAFCRFSAAANRASLCRSRSDCVREGSTRFAGRSESRLNFPDAVEDVGGGSLADPSRLPCECETF